MPLPSGTVTLMFTDVEGSTALAETLGDAWPSVVAAHRSLIGEAVRAAGGVLVDDRGEETLSAFATVRAAVAAAVAAQRAHLEHAWPEGGELRVRIGLHTGEPTVADAGYLGLDVHRGARICSLAHGGQVLLSQTTRQFLTDGQVRDLGEVELKGISRPERIFQLLATDLPTDFAPLRRDTATAVDGREHELAAAVRKLRGIRVRARPEPGLAELAWDVRRLMPTARPADREELVDLSAELFAAGRSAADADSFLAANDRRVLVKRHETHRELALVSRQAERELESIARRLAQLDELVERRRELDAVAVAVASALPSPPSDLRRRVREAAARVDEALAASRNDLGNGASRLRRTVTRGVYRQGNTYVVPVVDSVGVERLRKFEALRDARTFRRAQRIQERAQQKLQGAPHDGPHAGGGGAA